MKVARCATPSSVRMPSAELSSLLDVGQHRERQVVQVLVVRAPGVVHELAVGRAGQQLRVAVEEGLVLVAEAGQISVGQTKVKSFG